MTNETKVVEQRIIQRLINTIADYEEGGKFYSQVIPLHTQAYAIYDSQEKSGLYYVFGDGVHTYVEIRDGQSSLESSHEYAVFDEAWIALINSKANLDYMNFELAKRQYISNLINEITEENKNSTTLYPSVKVITSVKTELKTDIHAEANTRATVDANLENAIDDESIARSNSDNLLQDNINAEETSRISADNNLSNLISQESTRAQQAETLITNDLIAENTRAINTEEELSERITDNKDAIDILNSDEVTEGSVRTISKAYAEEAETNAKAYTNTRENAITTAYEAADLILTTDLTTETTSRIAADNSLNTAINSEKSRAEEAETTLTNNLASEINRATLAENNLSEIKANKVDVYTKTEIDSKLSAAMHFKGTKPTYNDLPKSGNETGDMWNILDTGMNYAWDGEKWDKLSETIDLSPFALTTYVDEKIEDEENAREAGDAYVDDKLDNFIGRVWKNYDEIDPSKGWFYTKYTKTDGSYALLFNENDGGGSQFYNKTLDSLQYVGTNDGSDGVHVQIYAKNKTSNIGARLAAAPTGIYYTNGKKNGSYTASDEIVTKADIAAIDFSPYATNVSLDEAKIELQGNIDTVSTNLNTEVTYRKDLANRLWKSYNEADPTKGYFYTKYTLPSTSYSLVFNESDGGGTQVYDKATDIISYVGANLEEGQSDKESAINVQIYSKNKTSNEGVRLNISSQKAYYLKGANKTNVIEREIATIGDLPTKTSQLDNDSDFTTNEALQAQVASLTQQIKDLKLLIPQEVFDASTARSAMNASGKVTLCEDINLGVLNIGGGIFANYNTSINLNGHTLQSGPTGGRALLLVRGTSNYTFNGDGQVIDTADDSSPVWCASQNASVTINNGTFIAEGHSECIYCELGTITINGGEFKCGSDDKRYLLNCKDANYQAGTAKIIVKGGKFWDFDPHDCQAEGEHTNFCADGYTTTSEEIDGHIIYTVIKA